MARTGHPTNALAKRFRERLTPDAAIMKILITGGAGYIGSTVASAAIDAGIEPIILDSLVTGQMAFTKGRTFYHGDIADKNLLQRIFHEHSDIFCTIHCAALILVPESVSHPHKYYRENVAKSLELFHTLVECGCPRIIFSSSASIYAPTDTFQVNEDSPLLANCPYARTKLMMEQILKDFAGAYQMQGLSLRYFNPIGADPQLRTGPHDPNPSHLLGALGEVEAGRRDTFTLTGVDWPTRDGTGIRDFVHVWDLARAHVQAVQHFERIFDDHAQAECPYLTINLGTQNGVTVREFVTAFERVLGHEIPKRDAPPRPGDVAGAYANSNRAAAWLQWRQEKSLEDGMRDALKWNAKRLEVLGY
jgi:UDP-glucose 4-epimerase